MKHILQASTNAFASYQTERCALILCKSHFRSLQSEFWTEQYYFTKVKLCSSKLILVWLILRKPYIFVLNVANFSPWLGKVKENWFSKTGQNSKGTSKTTFLRYGANNKTILFTVCGLKTRNQLRKLITFEWFELQNIQRHFWNPQWLSFPTMYVAFL